MRGGADLSNKLSSAEAWPCPTHCSRWITPPSRAALQAGYSALRLSCLFFEALARRDVLLHRRFVLGTHRDKSQIKRLAFDGSVIGSHEPGLVTSDAITPQQFDRPSLTSWNLYASLTPPHNFNLCCCYYYCCVKNFTGYRRCCVSARRL